MSLAQMLTWCRCPHLRHFIFDVQSLLMWFLLKQTKHRPALFNTSFLAAMFVTVLQALDA